MEKLESKTLAEFEIEWFSVDSTISKAFRFGQAICNNFILPKEVENLLFYEESVEICRDIVWQYVLGTLEY